MSKRKPTEPSLFPITKTDIIYETLKEFSIPKSCFQIMRNLVDGIVKEECLICCRGDCDICSIELKNCFKKIKFKIEKLNC